MQHPAFKPRRLGHANLFVGDLEKSVDFYSNVAGIQLVRREPGIEAAFHSNGNTHHDVGLIQCKNGARIGIGGYVQPSSFRGQYPGLNHFGWEMNSEAELVAAVRRAEAVGVKIVNYANHQISHSAYVPDPESNYHEFYADTVEDWRTIFNLEREELVSEQWDWTRNVPGRPPIHPPADERSVPGAIFHPRRINHATLAVADLDRASQFFRFVGGMTVTSGGDGTAAVHSSASPLDLVLVSSKLGLEPGLVGISFVVIDDTALARSQQSAARGQLVLAATESDAKRSVVVRDPDGLLVEFYSPRVASQPLPDPSKATSDPYWCLAA